ncbi:hypothetical protein JYU34_019619 [Plutella xylostella]|uniref:Uncharacterized protein n=1 Tax=Plutella xylostella TaxID=51655 RepID=A0ABQ7PYI8_PLUXY|nr:hypothetical protein JYU34_019619 [Plutella xylostella]
MPRAAASCTTVRRHVVFGRPLFRLPDAAHFVRAILGGWSSDLRSVWPIQLHFLSRISESILLWLVSLHNSVFEMVRGQNTFSICLRHLLTNTCSLLVRSSLTNHVSQPYKSTDLTFDSKIRTLVRRAMTEESQTGLSCAKADRALLMRASMSASVPPCGSTTLPRYVNLFTLSTASPFTCTAQSSDVLRRISLVLEQFMRSPSFSASLARSSILDCRCWRLVDSRQRSSAKSMSSNCCSCVHGRPLCDSHVALRITSSRTVIKRRGDSKQPCLTPAVTGIGSVSSPQCRTLHDEPVYRHRIIDMIFSGIPFLFKIFQMLDHFTLSNAFSKSTKRVNTSHCISLHCSRTVRNRFIWSVHDRPALKPACSLRSPSSIGAAIRCNSTLHSIFKHVGNRFMPLQFPQLVRSPFLGSFIIRPSFQLSGTSSFSQIFWKSENRTSADTSAFALKASTGIPSLPGALPFFSDCIALAISIFVGGLVSMLSSA